MCTRAVYLGPSDIVVTTRSMDWAGEIPADLWCLPRGMERHGAAGPSSLTWVSEYGSVVSAIWNVATADGMNEAGLVANLLYLTESEYVPAEAAGERRPLSLSLWAQYVLDRHATVASAVAEARDAPYYVVPVQSPDGHAGQVHLALSDASGDSAIFEYVGGELVIHHGREFQVMTNSPTFDRQLAIAAYWEDIGGTTMLPGTNRAADRFVRASFYVDAVEQTDDLDRAVAVGFSVIRNASVPIGITTPGEPNISSTRWRTVADHRGRRYFFETVTTPNVCWVEFANLDFMEGAEPATLALGGGVVHAGDTAAQFTPSAPFEPLAADPSAA
jgi:choloylglycine hydrolase